MVKKIGLLALLVALVGVQADALTYTRVTVATTATLVFQSQNPTNGVKTRVLVRNPGAVSVYVGDASVTTANGFEIAAGDSIGINLFAADQLYGIVASGTQVVYTIQGSNPQ